MFYMCSALTALDLSAFDTAEVTSMNSMFGRCYQLASLDVSGFDTSNVTDMGSMFWLCGELTALDLSAFDTAKVTDMRFMFAECSKLSVIYVSEKFVTDAVTEGSGMFFDCRSLIGSAGSAAKAGGNGIEYAHIDGGPENPGYFTAKS